MKIFVCVHIWVGNRYVPKLPFLQTFMINKKLKLIWLIIFTVNLQVHNKEKEATIISWVIVD